MKFWPFRLHASTACHKRCLARALPACISCPEYVHLMCMCIPNYSFPKQAGNAKQTKLLLSLFLHGNVQLESTKLKHAISAQLWTEVVASFCKSSLYAMWVSAFIGPVEVSCVEMITWAFHCELLAAKLWMGRRGPFSDVCGPPLSMQAQNGVGKQKWGASPPQFATPGVCKKQVMQHWPSRQGGIPLFKASGKSYIHGEQDDHCCLLRFSHSVVIFQPNNDLRLYARHFLFELPEQFWAGCLQKQNSSPMKNLRVKHDQVYPNKLRLLDAGTQVWFWCPSCNSQI